MLLGAKFPQLMTTQPKAIACLAVSGALAGCLGVFTYLKAMQELQDAGKVAVLCASYPLVALILTVIILKEPLTATRVLGTVLIIGGVTLLNR